MYMNVYIVFPPMLLRSKQALPLPSQYGSYTVLPVRVLLTHTDFSPEWRQNSLGSGKAGCLATVDGIN